MNLDRILHEKKQFAELADEDIELFLRERRFRSEHLNLEFKSVFPLKSNGKYDIREICKYIAGFSNEEGGIVLYGVADNIKDAAVSFPDYVPGLAKHPSVEDLSLWVTERIRPLVQSPAIRLFRIQEHTVAVLKVPEGVNRPYSHYDPSTKSLTFFKKTAGGIKELEPDEVKDLYWDAILDQARKIVRAGALKGVSPAQEEEAEDPLRQHREWAIGKLENSVDFGRLAIYCVPDRELNIPVDVLRQFVQTHRHDFSEVMRFYPDVEILQDGVSVGFYPRAVRQDIKSTARMTLYRTGLVAFDSQVDTTMDRENIVQPYWLTYEIQRHLQLAKAVLSDARVKKIHVALEADNIKNFSVAFGTQTLNKLVYPYSGSHRPIERDVDLADIHDYNGPKRNVVFPAVVEMMDEICRIFGLSKTPPGVWDGNGYLIYVQGLESQR